MSLAGWIFMGLAWGVVTTLMVISLYFVIKNKNWESENGSTGQGFKEGSERD